MTDSRKLTDNELEQVAGGGFNIGDGTNDVGFSIGNYVREGELKRAQFGNTQIVYRIDTLNGFNATATKYEKKSDGAVTTTTDQTIILSMMVKLDSQPDWVPAN